MQLSVHHITNYFRSTLEKIKSIIALYTNDKRIVNYILYGNGIFIVLFGTMIFFLNQERISNYLDVREAIGRLKEASEGYELELIRSQVTLKPDIKKINAIIKGAEKERHNIFNISKSFDNKTYIKNVDKYITILDKRLIIRDELINQYKALAKMYKDYVIIAHNAEVAIDDNVVLQLEMKHIMLNLEHIRLISSGQNREAILTSIHHLRNKLIYQEPIIQEKVGLLTDITEEIVKALRYLDTIRSSMQSDGHNTQLEYLNSLTTDEISYEELKFFSKLLLFLLMSIIFVAIQFIVLTIFFINKKRTEKLQKEAHETITKSKEIADRAKLYALDAQRTQYKLLYNFCSDFDAIISTVSYSSDMLKQNIETVNSTQCDASFFDKQKVSVSALNASIVALERWLSNYLEVYTPQNTWKDATDEAIDVTELFDKHFAESRFFIRDRQHLLSIFHGDMISDIVSDKEYLLKIFINMIYVSIKWSNDSWLKSSIVIKENDNKNAMDKNEEKKLVLSISVINGASNEKYLEGLELFHKENTSLQNENSENDSNDRFMVAALYYMRQICDIMQANIQFERNILDENILTVDIPVKPSSEGNKTIGVPLLKNKNILVVSPYNTILRNIEKQLMVFGLNVTSINDRYSAIGHIVGAGNTEQKYDLFLIDHQPPDIDAEALTKIIRENSQKNLAHIIVMTTEHYFPDIEQNKSLYDASFVKPVMPQLLKKKLEEFVEIQLYGTQTDDTDMHTSQEENDVCRFLAVMDQDLSTMLLQLILTKSNYHVDVVSSGAQIFELIEQYNYDFILVSNKSTLVIPENLAHDIRRHHSPNKDSVIIMIYDTLKDSVYKKLVRFGFDDFIPLPLSRSIFIEKIEKWADPIAQRMNSNGIQLAYDPDASRESQGNEDNTPLSEANTEETLNKKTNNI